MSLIPEKRMGLGQGWKTSKWGMGTLRLLSRAFVSFWDVRSVVILPTLHPRREGCTVEAWIWPGSPPASPSQPEPAANLPGADGRSHFTCSLLEA